MLIKHYRYGDQHAEPDRRPHICRPHGARVTARTRRPAPGGRRRTTTYLTLRSAGIAADLGLLSETNSADRGIRADGRAGQREPPAESEADPGGPDGSRGDNDDTSPFDVDSSYGLRQRIGFVLGPVLFALIFFSPTPADLTPEGQAVGAVTAWVAVWWMSEAIPIPAASLLPIVAFPLTGALPAAETTPFYADPLIFLFMGGFFLAMAMHRWELHRRIAFRTSKAAGTQPSRLILGFMVATAFLSMWVSNSATVMMMVPIALAVIYQTADLIDETDTIRQNELQIFDRTEGRKSSLTFV